MLVLLLAASLATILHLGTVAVVGAMLGATVEEVAIGVGGVPIWRRPLVRLGVPPSGYVRFLGAVEPDGAYNQLSRWRRTLIPLSGPVAVLALSAGLIGFAPALNAAGGAPAELGLPATQLQAVHAIQAAWVGLNGPLANAIGQVCARVAAFNLLPVPGLAGGDALFVALTPRNRASPLWRVVDLIQLTCRVLSLLVFLFLVVLWLVPLWAWWRG